VLFPRVVDLSAIQAPVLPVSISFEQFRATSRLVTAACAA